MPVAGHVDPQRGPALAVHHAGQGRERREGRPRGPAQVHRPAGLATVGSRGRRRRSRWPGRPRSTAPRGDGRTGRLPAGSGRPARYRRRTSATGSPSLARAASRGRSRAGLAEAHRDGASQAWRPRQSRAQRGRRSPAGRPRPARYGRSPHRSALSSPSQRHLISMLPRFPRYATGACQCWHAPWFPRSRPGPRGAGRAPWGLSRHRLAQTVSAVERTAKVASATKIANQTTMPITLARATVPWPITSVVTFTTW